MGERERQKGGRKGKYMYNIYTIYTMYGQRYHLSIRVRDVMDTEGQTHLDLFGERGREHHGLPLTHRWHPILLHNAADLWLEPHVQHPVSLVQHQIPSEMRRGRKEEEKEEGEGGLEG